jgi:hypothetical protein
VPVRLPKDQATFEAVWCRNMWHALRARYDNACACGELTFSKWHFSPNNSIATIREKPLNLRYTQTNRHIQTLNRSRTSFGLCIVSCVATRVCEANLTIQRFLSRSKRYWVELRSNQHKNTTAIRSNAQHQMDNILQDLRSNPSVIPLILLCYVGGLNRVVGGRLLPALHAYQQSRAPEHWINPALDFLVGTLLLNPTTRPYTAAGCLALHGLGIGMRLEEGKGVVSDLLIALIPLLALMGSLPVWKA